MWILFQKFGVDEHATLFLSIYLTQILYLRFCTSFFVVFAIQYKPRISIANNNEPNKFERGFVGNLDLLNKLSVSLFGCTYKQGE